MTTTKTGWAKAVQEVGPPDRCPIRVTVEIDLDALQERLPKATPELDATIVNNSPLGNMARVERANNLHMLAQYTTQLAGVAAEELLRPLIDRAIPGPTKEI